MKFDNDESFYCYVTEILPPSETPSPNAKFNPFKARVNCKLGIIDLVFWVPEKIGIKREDRDTWPIKNNSFVLVSFLNFEEVKKELERSLNNKYSNIVGLTLQGNYKSNLKYKVVDKEEVPKEIYDSIYINREEQFNKALQRLKEFFKNEKSWNDAKAFECFKNLIQQTPNFTTCPAAIGKHHSYEGGLLIHSNEVNYLCNKIADACVELNPAVKIDRDALNMSSWVHDIGKTEVYSLDDDKNPKLDGQKESKINHILRGYSIFNSVAKNYEFSSEFLEKVEHCILSHHDRIDWGSPVEPKNLEAIILAKADKISSSM